jgi:hypothetical protein
VLRVVLAAWRLAVFLGGKNIGGLLIYAAVFFAVLTVEHLIADGRPPSLVTYALTAAGLLGGAISHRVLQRIAYRPAKRALAARALRRRG